MSDGVLTPGKPSQISPVLNIPKVAVQPDRLIHLMSGNALGHLRTPIVPNVPGICGTFRKIRPP